MIGDGRQPLEVVDVAVDPDWQRRGICYSIMAALLEFLQANAPPSAYVSLIADGDASQLYQKFGFELTSPESVGMGLRI